jgi:hypothetical protein
MIMMVMIAVGDVVEHPILSSLRILKRVWTSGIRYDGQWCEDKMHGFGTITDRQGAKYKGNFYNGLRCDYDNDDHDDEDVDDNDDDNDDDDNDDDA